MKARLEDKSKEWKTEKPGIVVTSEDPVEYYRLRAIWNGHGKVVDIGTTDGGQVELTIAPITEEAK